MTTETPPIRQLAALESSLAQFLAGDCNATALSDMARAQDALLSALPPRYSEVLLNLMDRLESSALFSEESCSFSQKDLVANVQVWVSKAQEVLKQG